jgi:hypothetical protein
MARYRRLANRELLEWALVALAARFPVAMAPLSMVFLTRQSAGGYTLGSALAATYVIGEVVAASVQARPRRPPRAACAHS